MSKTTIRLMTKTAPLFDHAGLVLRPQWSEVELDDLEQDGLFAIEKYAGGPKMDAPHRLIMVHPLDESIYAEICAANASARETASAPKSGGGRRSDKKDA